MAYEPVDRGVHMEPWIGFKKTIERWEAEGGYKHGEFADYGFDNLVWKPQWYIIYPPFKGEVIVSNPLTILWIAITLFIQTVLIFGLGYFLARRLNLSYEDAAPTALIGASNHFEVAIATSVMLFGLSSGAALATVVGVLIEVPLMLMLVRICLRTRHRFATGR